MIHRLAAKSIQKRPSSKAGGADYSARRNPRSNNSGNCCFGLFCLGILCLVLYALSSIGDIYDSVMSGMATDIFQVEEQNKLLDDMERAAQSGTTKDTRREEGIEGQRDISDAEVDAEGDEGKEGKTVGKVKDKGNEEGEEPEIDDEETEGDKAEEKFAAAIENDKNDETKKRFEEDDEGEKGPADGEDDKEENLKEEEDDKEENQGEKVDDKEESQEEEEDDKEENQGEKEGDKEENVEEDEDDKEENQGEKEDDEEDDKEESQEGDKEENQGEKEDDKEDDKEESQEGDKEENEGEKEDDKEENQEEEKEDKEGEKEDEKEENQEEDNKAEKKEDEKRKEDIEGDGEGDGKVESKGVEGGGVSKENEKDEDKGKKSTERTDEGQLANTSNAKAKGEAVTKVEVSKDENLKQSENTNVGGGAVVKEVSKEEDLKQMESTLAGETSTITPNTKFNDTDCPFRNSPIYRKVFVYPNHGDVENGWWGDILSDAGKDPKLPRWPYLDLDIQSRNASRAHYNYMSQNVQYATELLVREIMINPKSCLRTYDPEEATLFYVPYLPSVEHHMGHDRAVDYSTSPYGQAILDIIEKQNYTGWEQHFGLTSKYWKRRGGSDHILVFSEPMHGLYHPRNRRGNYHFIHTQKQLSPPIVLSVELSTTFVKQYPKCAAKNILMPYPNTDGNWYNGVLDRIAAELLKNATLTTQTSSSALAGERELAKKSMPNTRPVAQHYSAGNHGTCRKLRQAMQQDYRSCSSSFPALAKELKVTHYSLGMRVSTFCPCPGGDSPSAKRHFDALIGQCIPIILSHDFVWPFTNEFDPDIKLDPSEFSLRLKAQDYEDPLLDPKTCKPKDGSKPGLQAYLESISAKELQRLRQGVEKARKLFSWYSFDANLPENPLREGVLPDGGTAHQLVKMLAERAAGAKWPACEEELKVNRGPDAWKFVC